MATKSSAWKSASAYRVLPDGRVQVKTGAKKNPAKKRKKNVEMGFYNATGFHPIRASADYHEARVGIRDKEDPYYANRSRTTGKKKVAAKKVTKKKATTKRKKNSGTYTRAMMLANLARGRAKRAANLKKKR